MDKKIEDEFKEAVFKQGFSLEQNVFRILEKDGWQILPNRNFFDSASNLTREFDLLAYRTISRLNTTIFTVLIIECKFNPHRIVFYTRQSKPELCLPQFYTGDFVQNLISQKTVRDFFSNLSRHKSFFLITEQVFGYQMFEELKKKESKNDNNIKTSFKTRQELAEKTIFGALSTTMQATLYEQKIRHKARNSANFIMFFPLVIFSDNLYKASLENRKNLRKQENFLYRTGMTFSGDESPDEFNIYISSVAKLSNLLKVFNYTHKQFAVSFFKKIRGKK